MSVDAAAERAALEAKDRDELQQIIGALGGKVTSRTRKPAMIDTILELTGVVTTSGDDDASAAPAESAAPKNDDRSAKSADGGNSGGRGDTKPSNGRDNSAGNEAKRDQKADDAKTDNVKADDAKTDNAKTDDGKADKAKSGNQGQRGQQQRSGQQQKANADNGGGNNGGGNNGGGSGGGNNNGGSGNNADAEAGDNDTDDGDDGEAGNKRRRRRGRNRDGNQQQEEFTGEPIPVAGYLDLRHDGYGFLRVQGFLPSRQDVYVSVKQTRQFGLRDGDHVEGGSRPAFRNEKNPAMLRIDKVNGGDPDAAHERPRFNDLTPVNPDERITLEGADPTKTTARLIDILCPIGKGQRGVILSPPASGKTAIITDIAAAITTNDPEISVLVVLVDERPEEVTELARAVPGAEVIASTFDRPADEHTRMVELVLARAERMVESGRDVVVLIDGLTSLVRAYNTATQASGKSLPGGLDLAALHPAKKLFGSARNTEEGGSLTMIATVAIETGSTLDNTIAEEFAGTANLEITLDRHMAIRRVFPALDISASAARQEAQLIPADQLSQVETLRRVLAELPDTGAASEASRPLERLIDRVLASASNEAFLNDIANGSSL